MMRRTGLPESLPLFAVSGAILMPRGRVPLTVIEPRYLQMVDDVLKTGDRLIGLIQPQGAGHARIGCAGRLVGFQELDDGRVLISLRAVSRFALLAVEGAATPYARGRVDWSAFTADRAATPQEDPHFDREAFLDRLRRYLVAAGLATDWDTLDEAGDELLINALSMALPFDPEEKQALLEAPDLTSRRQMMDGLMEIALHARKDDGSDRMQ